MTGDWGARIYERPRSSFYPRIALVLGHAVLMVGVWWLIYGAAPTTSGAGALYRAVLFGAALTYFLRTAVTILVFLKRGMGWGEAVGVAVSIATAQLLFAGCGAARAGRFDLWDGVALAVYIGGSCLNSGAEWQRHLWKRRPENQGRLYTGGLFRYAMHINYFGDILLFSGWAMLTRCPVLFIVPVVVAVGFVFVHVPNLDHHLHRHYGAAFDAYAARTAKLIPFLY